MSNEQHEQTDVVVVGAGQAGLATAEHLTNAGIPHIVIEKNNIAHAWQNVRWDSLVANGPAWHDRFPSKEFTNADPDEFVAKDQMAEYFREFAKEIGSDIREQTEVLKVTKKDGERGFTVETSNGTIDAKFVVAATGPFQVPAIPPIVPQTDKILQIHSNQYKNPEQLPEGAVLVVGAGSSGVQIAKELNDSGRKTFLAVGPHDRPPRAYRGHDFVYWLGVLGKWDMTTPAAGAEHVTIAVSGADGGHTVDFRRLGHDGVTLLGRANEIDGMKMKFGHDLAENIRRGDANYLSLLDEADEYIERNGLDFPEEPEAREFLDDPESVKNPIFELDLEEEGITTIIWATGFRVDYSWLQTAAVGEDGRPIHSRGVSPETGNYFVGLPWQSRRGSSFIWGVWHDAKYVVDQIGIQRNYAQYVPAYASQSGQSQGDAPGDNAASL